MSIVIPLAVHPYPVPPEVVTALKAAKEALCARDGVEFMLQLSPAVPGSPTRVLAFTGPTPFVCDSAKLRNWQDPEELMYWLEWIVNPAQPVELGFTVSDWVRWQIPGAVEIPEGIQQQVLAGAVYDDLPY